MNPPACRIARRSRPSPSAATRPGASASLAAATVDIRTMLRPSTCVRIAALGAIAVSCAPTALADPASHVFVPYAIEGRLQLAYAVGTEHDRAGGRETQQVLSVGGTPTARWTTSVYAAWAATDGA